MPTLSSCAIAWAFRSQSGSRPCQSDAHRHGPHWPRRVRPLDFGGGVGHARADYGDDQPCGPRPLGRPPPGRLRCLGTAWAHRVRRRSRITVLGRETPMARLLIVEPEADFHALFDAALAQAGYVAVEAANSYEAGGGGSRCLASVTRGRRAPGRPPCSWSKRQPSSTPFSVTSWPRRAT